MQAGHWAVVAVVADRRGVAHILCEYTMDAQRLYITILYIRRQCAITHAIEHRNACAGLSAAVKNFLDSRFVFGAVLWLTQRCASGMA